MKAVVPTPAPSRLPRRWIPLASLACSLLHSPLPALAQDPEPAPSPAAEALFREAKDLVEQGRLPEACEKFEASLRLERALGALLNLADCHEGTGRTASAWVEYAEAAALADRTGDSARARYARKRGAALEPALGRVVLQVAPNPSSIVVKLGDREIAPGAWRSPVPLDPGDYVVAASAPGHEPWRATIRVAAGPGSVLVAIPALRPVAARAPTRLSTPSADSGNPPGPPTLAWVLGGLGALGLGVGGYYGFKALSTQAAVDEHCGPRYCDDYGLALEDDARRYSTISTVGIGAGLGLSAVAAWVWLSDAKPGRPGVAASLRVSPGAADVSVRF